MSKLQKLFNLQSIAIVGASQEEGKIGNILVKNVLELGYGGEVFLVNLKYDNLFDIWESVGIRLLFFVVPAV